MADSPRYQRANLVYADMPNIQPVDLQEQLNANKRIGAALDQMTSITTDIGKKYAIEAAAKYSLDNPVTQEQLIDAQKNNSNPIAKDLKGGTIFNETLKKVYAQQASAEFTNIAYTHFEDVDKRVKSGELTNPDEIKQALNSVIEPQKNVLGQIDVETGLSYDAKLKSYANTYYKGALNELDRQARERVDLTASDTMNALTKMFEKDLINQYDPIVLKGLLDTKLQDGDLSFKQGSHRGAYNNQLRKQLEYAINNKFAEDMANAFGNEAVAMQSLEKGKAGKWTAFWNAATPDQKDDLRRFVSKEISFKSAGAEEAERKFKSEFGSIKSMLQDGIEPDNKTLQRFAIGIETLKADSPARKEAEILTTLLKVNKDLNSLSLSDRQAYEEKMRANVTLDNYVAFDFVKEANSKYRDNISKDFVGTMKKQDKYKGSILDFSLPDSQFQAQADNRILLADQFGNVNQAKPKYFDEGEIEAFRAEYQKSNTEGKQLLVGRIVKTFGAKSGVIFDQLSPKDPVMGHLGGLFINQSNKETLDAVVKGQEIINSGIKYDVNPTRESSVIRNVVGDAFYDVPKIQTAIVETAKALYAEEAVRKNYAKFSESAFEQALQKAAGQKSSSDGTLYGGIVKYNGVKVSIPSSIPTKEFDDVMDKATLADFRYSADNFARRANTNGLFDDNSLEYTSDKLKGAVLIPIDNNRAKLRIGNSLLTLKGGYDLVINLDVLYRKLKDEKRL